jgi:hypothetical protein
MGKRTRHYRYAWITDLAQRDPGAAKSKLLEVLRQYNGDVAKAAHVFAVNYHCLHELVTRLRIDLVKLRRLADEPEWLTLTRKELTK